MIRLILLLVVLAFSISRMFEGSARDGRTAALRQGRFAVTLDHTVDGDTAWFRDAAGAKLKVRCIGIDAPESDTPTAYNNSRVLAARLLHTAQKIELEQEPSHPEDEYGRMLAWIWLTMPDGSEQLLQEEMIRQGQAELFRSESRSLYYSRLEKLAPR